MKKRLLITAGTAFFYLGCGQIELPAEDEKTENNSVMSSQEYAANELYLEDVEDSASADEDSGTETNSSVLDDMRERRLNQMVEMIFGKLDADNSEDLTLEEFLVSPKNRADQDELDEEQKTNMLEKMTEDFEAASGEDDRLTTSELFSLLENAAPRVSRHRNRNFQGQHKERLKKSWEEIISEYDADGDGLLSEEEFSRMISDRGEQQPRHQRSQMGRRTSRHGPDGRHRSHDRRPRPIFEGEDLDSEDDEKEE